MLSKRSRASYESDLNARPDAATFVTYGTPLPQDANVADDGSYVPIHKQEALDERGRKRFHGAFTGGWSAG
jgi:G patch domain-containing protein 1